MPFAEVVLVFSGSRRGVRFEEIVEYASTLARERHKMKYGNAKRSRDYRYSIVTKWFAGRLAAAITSEEIAAKLAEHCKTSATFNQYRVALSHAYKLAMDNKKVSENPARLVKLRTLNNERVRFLEYEEEFALRDAVREHWPIRESEVDLALQTGMRFAEPYELQWGHVNLERKLVTIPLAKSGRREHVPLNSDALAALAKLRALLPEGLDERATAELLVRSTPSEWTHRQWWNAALAKARSLASAGTTCAIRSPRG